MFKSTGKEFLGIFFIFFLLSIYYTFSIPFDLVFLNSLYLFSVTYNYEVTNSIPFFNYENVIFIFLYNLLFFIFLNFIFYVITNYSRKNFENSKLPLFNFKILLTLLLIILFLKISNFYNLLVSIEYKSIGYERVNLNQNFNIFFDIANRFILVACYFFVLTTKNLKKAFSILILVLMDGIIFFSRGDVAIILLCLVFNKNFFNFKVFFLSAFFLFIILLFYKLILSNFFFGNIHNNLDFSLSKVESIGQFDIMNNLINYEGLKKEIPKLDNILVLGPRSYLDLKLFTPAEKYAQVMWPEVYLKGGGTGFSPVAESYLNFDLLGFFFFPLIVLFLFLFLKKFNFLGRDQIKLLLIFFSLYFLRMDFYSFIKNFVIQVGFYLIILQLIVVFFRHQNNFYTKK